MFLPTTRIRVITYLTVVLIHPTPESADTPEVEMLYDEVVDTMGDDMLDEME